MLVPLIARAYRGPVRRTHRHRFLVDVGGTLKRPLVPTDVHRAEHCG